MIANISIAYLLGIATMPFCRFIANLFRETMEEEVEPLERSIWERNPDYPNVPKDGSRGDLK